jgi:hypothetical protein
MGHRTNGKVRLERKQSFDHGEVQGELKDGVQIQFHELSPKILTGYL